MKALSIREPWLTAIVSGEKSIETRTWYTRHRRDLLLVGSKSPRGDYAGKAACIVNLVCCRRMFVFDEEFAMCPFYDGLYAWVLDDVRRIVPFPVRGQRGLYDVPDDAIFAPSGDVPCK